MFKASNIIFIQTMTNHKQNITRHPELHLPTLCLMTLPANTCELLNVTSYDVAWVLLQSKWSGPILPTACGFAT